MTNEKLCEICLGFTEEQIHKIKNKRSFIRKQKVADTSRDDELDLLGDKDVRSFAGSRADLKSVAETFFHCVNPVQWTIAYLVGADRPAKRRKKTSCVSTGRSVRSTCALARWRVILPSCLDGFLYQPDFFVKYCCLLQDFFVFSSYLYSKSV